MAIPKKDTLLVAWGLNFDQKATLSPVTYNLTPAQASAFHTLYQAFVSAFNAVATARESGTRSKALTSTKDAAKAALLRTARELYGFIQGSTTVTVANKEDIGVNPRNRLPSPIPPPDSAPDIDVIAVSGNTVKIRLHEAGDSSRRGKPAGVDGASVFSFIGAAPPNEESAWTFQGVTARTSLDIIFPPGTPPGARVWFTAFWFNQRKERGPASTPVGTNIPGGSAMAA
jgi:hypothetical protein